MTNNLTTDEAVRGHVLVALDNDQDGTLADSALSAVIKGAGFNVNPVELKKHLDYLGGKNLIIVKARNRQVTMATLTAEGKDLIDGRIQVPGIITPY